VLVNLAFRESFLSYHSARGAYVAFIAMYVLYGALTRLIYQRREVLTAAPVPARGSYHASVG
jgi:NNP family nitrate/nitrite transporter-like MFS transporter